MKLGPKEIPQVNQLRMLEAMKAWLDPMRPHAQPQNEDNMYMLHIHAPMICISLNIYTVYTRTKYICVSKCTVLSVCILCIYIYITCDNTTTGIKQVYSSKQPWKPVNKSFPNRIMTRCGPNRNGKNHMHHVAKTSAAGRFRNRVLIINDTDFNNRNDLY